MTSSPGSMKPIKALSMPLNPRQREVQSHVLVNLSPSFAPVVIETSVSGFNFFPKKGEYASAMACLRRGRPYVV